MSKVGSALGALLLATLALPARSAAGEVHAAVAASFAEPARELAAEFERRTGHRVLLSTGSTGKLYAQIAHGAPFEVFLAADAERPRRLEAEGLAVAGSRFPYALGRLALWSPQPGRVDPAGRVLAEGSFRHLAMANPKTAPYGAAARAVLERLGLWERLSPRVVQGEDVGQAYQFVASGGAELGFLALAQIVAAGEEAGGSRWIVPTSLHPPIEQQAVLLARGADDPAAKAFLGFLRGPSGRALVERSGYSLP
jgi:molybdate transport system substrate-binding protein